MKNRYRVPKRQWKKWSKTAQGVFNLVYGASRYQNIMTHPKAARVSQKHWETPRWNFAWIAANAADGLRTAVEK